MASWTRQVSTRLNAVKQCPGSAGDGVVNVSFRVQRDGRITGARIVKSSGTAALDGAALSMIGGMGLLPPPPSGIFTLKVPIHFGCHGTTGKNHAEISEEKYLRTVYDHVRDAFPPAGKPSSPKKALVFFAIRDDGTLERVAIQESSGDPQFDEETKGHIEKASPVPKPPKGMRKEMLFGYAVDESGEAHSFGKLSPMSR